MKVYNVTIPKSAIDAVVERMREKRIKFSEGFTCSQVCCWLESAGISNVGRYKYDTPAYRAADRIIQQQRKKGNIAYKNGVWMWIGG